MCIWYERHGKFPVKGLALNTHWFHGTTFSAMSEEHASLSIHAEKLWLPISIVPSEIPFPSRTIHSCCQNVSLRSPHLPSRLSCNLKNVKAFITYLSEILREANGLGDLNSVEKVCSVIPFVFIKCVTFASRARSQDLEPS